MLIGNMFKRLWIWIYLLFLLSLQLYCQIPGVLEYEQEEILVESFSFGRIWKGSNLGAVPGLLVETFLDEKDDDPRLKVVLTFSDTGSFVAALTPEKPIPLGLGIKNLKAMVAANNFRHRLAFLITDKNGNFLLELEGGYMNWIGWKEVYLPAISYLDKVDLWLGGIKIYINPMQVWGGSVVYYFDEIRATAVKESL